VSTSSEASAVSPAVVGIGTDLVMVPRMGAALARRPRLAARLFTPAEREILEPGRSDSARVRSMAARLAAKEAVMKALGVGLGEVGFHEIEVRGGRGSAPSVTLHGRAAERARAMNADAVSISMSHDGHLAMATAVASRRCTCNPS